MGGLYVSPTSSEISWKRRAFRVSSEALLCLGVATIVASFVVEIGPTGQKPNIWILIGGLIMIIASVIGWSLTFCLMIDPEESRRNENTFTGIIVNSNQTFDDNGNKNDDPIIKKQGFFGTEYYVNPQINKKNFEKINKMKGIDKNAPLHSVEVVIPQEFLRQGGNLDRLPYNLSPNYFDQFFSQDNVIQNDHQIKDNNTVHLSSSHQTIEDSTIYSSNQSQLPGYSKMPNNYDPIIAKKLGKIPPTPDQKRVAGYEDARTYHPDKRPRNNINRLSGKSDNSNSNSTSADDSQTNKSTKNILIKNKKYKKRAQSRPKEREQNYNNRKKNDNQSDSSYSTEIESITHSYTDSYTVSQDYEEVKYKKRNSKDHKYSIASFNNKFKRSKKRNDRR